MGFKKYFLITIQFLFLSLLILSVNGYNYKDDFNINFDGVLYSDSNFKVYYNINSYQEKELNSKVSVEIFYNNSKVNECSYNINKKENVKILKRVFCVIPPSGQGIYTFKVKIDDTEIYKLSHKKYLDYDLNKDFFSNINFEEVGLNKTKVIINVFSKNNSIENDKSLEIKVEIPKEVISYLDDDTQKLIESNLEYKIIDPDPVIAWDVETPKKIEYNISKKISEGDREKFIVDVTEKKSFTYVKFIIILLIVFIIIITLFPIYKKNNKIKKHIKK